jgi:hypothetical protein
MAILSDAPQFGRLLERRTFEKRVWLFVVPGVLVAGALVVAALISVSRVSGLEDQLRVARQQVVDAQRAVEDRDKLLQKARADEDVLRTAGQGAAVLAASAPDGTASGVAVYHPERHALQVHAYGLRAPPEGQEYRVDAVKQGGERTSVGVLNPDERGAAFVLARDVPEGATQVAVRLAPAGTVLLTGALPRPGEAGVVAAPPVQARTPATPATPARRRASGR